MVGRAHRDAVDRVPGWQDLPPGPGVVVGLVQAIDAVDVERRRVGRIDLHGFAEWPGRRVDRRPRGTRVVTPIECAVVAPREECPAGGRKEALDHLALDGPTRE